MRARAEFIARVVAVTSFAVEPWPTPHFQDMVDKVAVYTKSC
jgi:hypothetical protein